MALRTPRSAPPSPRLLTPSLHPSLPASPAADSRTAFRPAPCVLFGSIPHTITDDGDWPTTPSQAKEKQEKKKKEMATKAAGPAVEPAAPVEEEEDQAEEEEVEGVFKDDELYLLGKASSVVYSSTRTARGALVAVGKKDPVSGEIALDPVLIKQQVEQQAAEEAKSAPKKKKRKKKKPKNGGEKGQPPAKKAKQ